MKTRSRLAFFLILAGTFLPGSFAYSASPVLSNIRPQGIQRGTETEVVVSGARLGDAQEILFYETGITAGAIKVINDNQFKIILKVASDCTLGEHAIRVRTAGGLSELRTVYISALPTVLEKEPNSEFAAAQAVPMNVTVTGTVEYEDVDYFKVTAKKGERIAAELEGLRLANGIFDPHLAIMNKGRFVLGSSDDHYLLNQDPAVVVIAPEDGTYYIEVREASYRGDGNCYYRLHLGNFPRPNAVYPSGGKAGDTINFTFVGDPAGTFQQTNKLPMTAMTNKYGLFANQGKGISPSPNWIRVVDFQNVLETEPNDELGKATKTDLPLPLAFNGIIEKPGDQDCFRFKATAGQAFHVTAYARQLRSPLDPVIHLYYADGRYIAGSDDAIGPDSYIRFQIPATGEYILRVHDHLNKGGPDYTYRVEFMPIKPVLTVAVPEFVQYSQERRVVAIARGNRMATLLTANRVDFGGELKMDFKGLPKGVTAHNETMHPGLTVMPVMFEAAKDAPLGASLVDVQAAHIDPKQNITGSFSQDLGLVYGEPNITLYWKYTCTKLAIAVVEDIPYTVEVVEPKAPLLQDGSANFKIKVVRKPGFKGAITVYNIFNPPGMSSVPAITIPDGQTEGLYGFSANRGTEPRVWKLAFQAVSDAGKGPIWCSTQLASVRVAVPYAEMGVQMTAAEQGKPTEVVVKVDQKVAFPGKAALTLVGLPAYVTSKPIEITKDQKEAIFKLEVGKNAPAGQHKSLFCQMTVTEAGEPTSTNLGFGGVLRIDPPPPPKKNEPAATAKPAAAPAAAAAAPKRLTRLEQLRLEQAEKAKQAGAKK